MSQDERQEDSAEIPEISARELDERMKREHPLVLLDVREAFEREIADLPGSGQLHIPMGELLDRVDELDADTNLVVYCRTGARSGWAVRQLREKGFEKAMNLRGGVMGWREQVDPTLTEY